MYKIYFACSIRGGRDGADSYALIAKEIKSQANLLTEVFADNKLTDQGMNLPDNDIWTKDINWVKESDAIIAEVTNPSLGVGYEIAKAEDFNKPVLALFNNSSDRKLSAMVAGSPKTNTQYYKTNDEVRIIIKDFIVNLNKSGA